MRLYIKLLCFILATTAIQRCFLSDGQSSELWFGFRCQFAYFVNDEPMIESLINEAHRVQFGAWERVNAAGG